MGIILLEHLPKGVLPKQDVIGHQSTPRPDFSVKEIGSNQDIPVRANKLAPGCSLFSFWDWREVTTFKMLPTVWSLTV